MLGMVKAGCASAAAGRTAGGVSGVIMALSAICVGVVVHAGCWHRDGCDRARGHLLSLLWRCIPDVV